MLDKLLSLDGNILLFIQDNIRADRLDPVMKVITSLGNVGFIWLVVSLVLLVPKKTRIIGVLGLTTLVIDYGVNNIIIKNIVQRPRPFTEVEGLVCIIKEPLDSSFPSSHTGSSVAASLVFLKKLPRKIGIPLVVLAVLISFSRMYVGVHYPSDVLFGALSGVAFYLVTLKFERPFMYIMDRLDISGWGCF